MNITEDVVRDLLPVYFSGESSADTQAVVEAYFRQHPDFEAAARLDASMLREFDALAATPPDAAGETAALDRTKAVLRWQRVLFALALTLSLNAITLGFSFEVGDGRFRLHWLTLPGQAQAICAILLLAAVLWVLYFRATRRVRSDILGR